MQERKFVRVNPQESPNAKDPKQLLEWLENFQMFILAYTVMVFYRVVGYRMRREDAAYSFSQVSVILRDDSVLYGRFTVPIHAPPPSVVATYNLETGILNKEMEPNCPERYVAVIALVYVASRCYPDRLIAFEINGQEFEAQNGEVRAKPI